MRATGPRAGLRLLGPAIVLSLAAVFAGPGTAALGAPTLRTAQGEATELRQQVDRLRLEVALAVEDHNAAADLLGEAVRRELQADRAADASDRGRAASAHDGVRRMRALYMAGGTASLYAGVLQDRGIADVLRRTSTVSVLTRHDASVTGAHQQRAAAADIAAAELTARTQQQVGLERAVQATGTRVTDLLRESTERLAAADATVVRLADADRERIAAAAEAAAATALAATAGAGGSTRGPDQAPAPEAASAVVAALSMRGRPYSWGAAGPASFDCSGLIQWAYRQAAVALPRVSRDQFRSGRPVSLHALAPGDLLFYAVDTADPGSIYHVGMYLGEGTLIQAPRTGDVVQIAPVRLNDLIGAIRPVTSQPSQRTS